MPRSREYYKNRVAARVDVLRPQANVTGGQTGIEAPMPLIDDELDDSAEYILRNAPVALVFSTIRSDKKHFHGPSVENVDTRVIIDDNLKAVVPVPADFLRFVSIKLSGWRRSLKELMDSRDPRYKFQEGNKYTSGSPDKPVGALVSFSAYSNDEKAKYDIDQTLSQNQTLANLYNAQTPSGGTILATGDIIALTGQTNDSENGIYLVKASGAPTKLSDEVTTINRMMALELYRASTDLDEIDEFHYVPKLKAEEMPNELADALIWHCAGRVFSHLGDATSSDRAMKEADNLLMSLKTGLMGEA
jgi:hypothetical protein